MCMNCAKYLKINSFDLYLDLRQGVIVMCNLKVGETVVSEKTSLVLLKDERSNEEYTKRLQNAEDTGSTVGGCVTVQAAIDRKTFTDMKRERMKVREQDQPLYHRNHGVLLPGFLANTIVILGLAIIALQLVLGIVSVS